MYTAIVLVAASAVVNGMTTISGEVVDTTGTPVAARVFLEPGLGGALREVKCDAGGGFRFDDVPAGDAGVFAHAAGLAFGGRHLNIPADNTPVSVKLILAESADVSGKVVDPENRPVEGARILRVALLSGDKVGIPLAKLVEYGFKEPVSGEDGAFHVPDLPRGGTVALKIGHPRFAQEGVTDVEVEGRNLRVVMYPGVIVEGSVRSRGSKMPVTNANVIVRSAQRPYHTAVAKTDNSGGFVMRLKPGVYLYQAAGAAYHTPGWRKLTITGRKHIEKVDLFVAGVGTITGKVCDAVTGDPVAGAKLVLETQGNVADIVRTGSNGMFKLSATEGENIVRLHAAAGYRKPETSAVRVDVVESKQLELPTFWLAPIPEYTVLVQNGQGEPADNAVVQILRPRQFGLRETDDTGRVYISVASLPPDRRIVGTAETVDGRQGALFAVDADSKDEHVARLFEFASVSGQVVDEEGRFVEGAIVGGVFADKSIEDALLLWRTVSRPDGSFRWRGIVPHVPQKCVATTGDEHTGASQSFNLEPSAELDVGNVVLPDAVQKKSMYGESLRWYREELLSENAPGKEAQKGKAAIVIYCRDEHAPVVVEGLETAQRFAGDSSWLCAVMVQGNYEGAEDGPAVYRGTNPGTATTYVVGSDDKVVLETFGLPPLWSLASFGR